MLISLPSKTEITEITFRSLRQLCRKCFQAYKSEFPILHACFSTGDSLQCNGATLVIPHILCHPIHTNINFYCYNCYIQCTRQGAPWMQTITVSVTSVSTVPAMCTWWYTEIISWMNKWRTHDKCFHMNKYLSVYFHKILLQQRLGLLCGVVFFFSGNL